MFGKKRVGLLIVFSTVFLLTLIPHVFAVFEGLYFTFYSMPDIVTMYTQASSLIDFVLIFMLITSVARLSLAKMFSGRPEGAAPGAHGGEENPAFKLLYVSLGLMGSASLVIYSKFYGGGQGLLIQFAPYWALIATFIALVLLYKFVKGEERTSASLGSSILMLLLALFLAGIFLPGIFAPSLDAILQSPLGQWLLLFVIGWALWKFIQWGWNKRSRTPAGTGGTGTGGGTSGGGGAGPTTPAVTTSTAKPIRVRVIVQPARGPYTVGQHIVLTALIERKAWIRWKPATENFGCQWQIGSINPTNNNFQIPFTIDPALAPNPSQRVPVRVTVTSVTTPPQSAASPPVIIEIVQTPTGPTGGPGTPTTTPTFTLNVRKVRPAEAPIPTTTDLDLPRPGTADPPINIGNAFLFEPTITGANPRDYEIEITATTDGTDTFNDYDSSRGNANFIIGSATQKTIICNFKRRASWYRRNPIVHTIQVIITITGGGGGPGPGPHTGGLTITRVRPNSAPQDAGVITLTVEGTGLDTVDSLWFPLHGTPGTTLHLAGTITRRRPTSFRIDVDVSTDHSGGPSTLGHYDIHVEDSTTGTVADHPNCFEILPPRHAPPPSAPPTLTVTNTVTGTGVPNIPPGAATFRTVNSEVGHRIEFTPDLISGAYTVSRSRITRGGTRGESIDPIRGTDNFEFTPASPGTKEIEFEFSAGRHRETITVIIDVTAPTIHDPVISVRKSGSTAVDVSYEHTAATINANIGDTITFFAGTDPPGHFGTDYRNVTVARRGTTLGRGETVVPTTLPDHELEIKTADPKTIRFEFEDALGTRRHVEVNIIVGSTSTVNPPVVRVETPLSLIDANPGRPTPVSIIIGQKIKLTADTNPTGDISSYRVNILPTYDGSLFSGTSSGSSGIFELTASKAGRTTIEIEFNIGGIRTVIAIDLTIMPRSTIHPPVLTINNVSTGTTLATGDEHTSFTNPPNTIKTGEDIEFIFDTNPHGSIASYDLLLGTIRGLAGGETPIAGRAVNIAKSTFTTPGTKEIEFEVEEKVSHTVHIFKTKLEVVPSTTTPSTIEIISPIRRDASTTTPLVIIHDTPIDLEATNISSNIKEVKWEIVAGHSKKYSNTPLKELGKGPKINTTFKGGGILGIGGTPLGNYTLFALGYDFSNTIKILDFIWVEIKGKTTTPPVPAAVAINVLNITKGTAPITITPGSTTRITAEDKDGLSFIPIVNPATRTTDFEIKLGKQVLSKGDKYGRTTGNNSQLIIGAITPKKIIYEFIDNANKKQKTIIEINIDVVSTITPPNKVNFGIEVYDYNVSKTTPEERATGNYKTDGEVGDSFKLIADVLAPNKITDYDVVWSNNKATLPAEIKQLSPIEVELTFNTPGEKKINCILQDKTKTNAVAITITFNIKKLEPEIKITKVDTVPGSTGAEYLKELDKEVVFKSQINDPKLIDNFHWFVTEGKTTSSIGIENTGTFKYKFSSKLNQFSPGKYTISVIGEKKGKPIKDSTGKIITDNLIINLIGKNSTGLPKEFEPEVNELKRLTAEQQAKLLEIQKNIKNKSKAKKLLDEFQALEDKVLRTTQKIKDKADALERRDPATSQLMKGLIITMEELKKQRFDWWAVRLIKDNLDKGNQKDAEDAIKLRIEGANKLGITPENDRLGIKYRIVRVNKLYIA